MQVQQVAQAPSPPLRPQDTVLDAVHALCRANAGCAAVVDQGALVGVFSERDVLLRVVAARRDPATTLVRDVMTSSVKTVPVGCGTDEAISVMVANHIRHVVIVNEQGTVVGVASARDVFRAHVECLDDQVRSLAAFAGCDCPGG